MSAISAVELTSVANTIESNTFRSFETYIVATVMYAVMTLVFRLVFWLIGQIVFGEVRAYRMSRRTVPTVREVAP